MRLDVLGLHHVSGIVRDAQVNVEFYTDTLGLRFVKRTVNFEDRFAYHLHYGDARGRAGSVLTFFPVPDEPDGRVGRPQIAALALSVPNGSLDFWRTRLTAHEAVIGTVGRRFDERVLAFKDPDGTHLELVTRPGPTEPWDGAVPPSSGIGGLAGVSLLSASPYVTASLLETFGFTRVGQEGSRVRYDTGRGVVDILDRDASFGREGAGTIHHVAFGVDDVDALHTSRDTLAGRDDVRVSYVHDRDFYHSLYIRDAGGILFELATEPIELTANDPAPGEHLYLPARFEADRETIEAHLPRLELP